MPLNQLESLIIRKCGYHRKEIKTAVLLMTDLLCILMTLPLALFVRLDFRPPANYIELLFTNYLLIGALCYFLFFFIFKIYSTMIRLANFNTAIRISVASLCAATFFYVLTNNILHLDPIPRSVFLIQMLIYIPLVILPRFSFRIIETIVKVFDKGTPTIIYGAGRTTNFFLPALLKPASGIKVVGLVDDDLNKRKCDVQGIQVLGTGSDLEYLIRRHAIEQVIICMPHLSGPSLRTLLSRLRQLSVSVKIAPDAFEYIRNKKNLNRIDFRDINIEDLLRRPLRKVNREQIEGMIQDQAIMVTGGGGSIGSELCRQIIAMAPKVLLISDASEFNLYTICEELKELFPHKNIVPILGNLSEPSVCNRIFNTHHIDIVLHAAAYKHVPLVEDNVNAAVQNNVAATLHLFDNCWRHKVKRVILISSDKAVRPTNVMGATKRLCELIGLWYSQSHSGTIFSAVRFGNVLGSSGSVVPKFLRQIKDGSPVTITHPEITRYFMLIPEAVSLVLQAAQSSKSGDIYVLDMGEPVKILDLARDLIAITGMKEGVDIHIEFNGLRKGEKMFEELYLGSEQVERVSTDYYRVASSNIMENSFIQRLHHLLRSLNECSPATAKDLLFELIRDYDSSQQVKTTATDFKHPILDGLEYKAPVVFDPLEVGV